MKITAGGVVAAERTKFSSLRSAWITTGVSAALLIALGLIASASFSGDGLSAVDLVLSAAPWPRCRWACSVCCWRRVNTPPA